jgi:hypothetical protein
MAASSAVIVIGWYCETHRKILSLLQKLTDEQMHWHPEAGNNSIAWHAWHVGRWADHMQAAVPGMTPELSRRLEPPIQIWHAEGLAERWGFDHAQLGYAETGMSMSDDAALHLPFPTKAILLDYVETTFAAAERAFGTVDDKLFVTPEQPQPLTEGVWGEAAIGDAILSHISHDSRHLGMMECLLGLQGQRGTATL